MLNPDASNIENAVILFGITAPGLALLYFVMHMRHRRRRQVVELSLLDVIGDLSLLGRDRRQVRPGGDVHLGTQIGLKASETAAVGTRQDRRL
jgi:hypothetical protein